MDTRATTGSRPLNPVRRGGGFSLVELIVVIVITGIMASTVGLFIAGPIQAFFDQARRGELVDAAQLALLRMGRDLRGALPNSVRVSGNAIEMLYTLDGDRYRTELPGAPADRLEFVTGGDSSFTTLARLDASQAAPGSTLRLAIYPLNQAGANPYSDAVLTPASTSVNVSGAAVTVGGVSEFPVVLSAPQAFPFDSPTKRVFLVEGPVSYFCDTASRELLRYSGYAVQSGQPAARAALDALVAPVIIVKNAESCGFGYDPGTSQRNAVVSLELVLESQGERIRLLRQVHVDNSP